MVELSIVIPAYNAEKTISRCLNSIVGQTHEMVCKHIEIIVIDDGSTDGTVKECKQFESFDFVHIISKKNAGVSAARNCGLDVCTGRWVAFVDSDDMFSQGALQYILSIIKKYGADNDALIGGFACTNGDLREVKVNTSQVVSERCIEDYDNRIDELLNYSRGFWSIWHILYKKEVIDKNMFRFKEGCNIAEDVLWNAYYFNDVSKMLFFEHTYYLYVYDMSVGLTRRVSIDNLKQSVDLYRLVTGDHTINSQKVIEMMALTFLDQYMLCSKLPKEFRSERKNIILKNSNIFDSLPHSKRKTIVRILRRVFKDDITARVMYRLYMQ